MKQRVETDGDSAALHRAIEAFWSEYHASSAFDSEFSPNPYTPGSKIDDLVALGPVVIPFLGSLVTSTQRDLRLHGLAGLGQFGAATPSLAMEWIEGAINGEYDGLYAIFTLEKVRPERYWQLELYRRPEAVESIARRHESTGTLAPFIARLLETRHDRAVATALQTLRAARGYDDALLEVARRALMSDLPLSREKAAVFLAEVPRGTPAEALIEAAVLTGRVGGGLLERVAWHSDSVALLDVIVRNGHVATLAGLIKRRRCAGLTTPADRVRALVEKKLRNPERPWRYEQHDVHDAAECAFELGDPELLPALVDAVRPENGGYAWGPLVNALAFHGDVARALVEAEARRETSRARVDQLALMRAQLKEPTAVTVEWGDRDFIGGSIDHTTGGAFESYGRALRAEPSAHAAFQLAWIDRAFGVPIVDDRVRWIRSLGCHDEALLAELATPVTALEGLRLSWRNCKSPDSARVAAAGLYGLAFRGSADVKHEQQAEAHVERVRLACQ